MTESITLSEADDGQRLDRWLKKKFPDTGFGQMQKILRTGQVRVDGKRVKGDARLAAGQVLRIPPQLLAPQKKEGGVSEKDERFIQSLVIYKDDDVIALNKPAGLAVQGGSKIVKHVDGMLDGLKFGGLKPHLVHRLDKETSGVLLLARSPKMAARLGEMFRGRDIRKYYWAVTVPAPELHQGKIKSSLAKTEGPEGERVRTVDSEEGKSALTYYSVMEAVGKKLAWVAFWPKTGRTHQIRVHAAEMGCPLLGDEKYGYRSDIIEASPEIEDSLHLHARRIIMPHPVTGKTLDITAPLGTGMRKTWKYFGFNADDKSDPFEDIE